MNLHSGQAPGRTGFGCHGWLERAWPI
jgi:hypothetical protein